LLGFLGFFPETFPPKNFRLEKFSDFQISRQNFLGRPTFDRKFFRILKFRAENLSAREISIQKKYRRKKFQSERAGRDRSCGILSRPLRSVGDVGKFECFSGFCSDRPKNFGTHRLSRYKKSENLGKMETGCNRGQYLRRKDLLSGGILLPVSSHHCFYLTAR
jgi:hypothetical protein